MIPGPIEPYRSVGETVPESQDILEAELELGSSLFMAGAPGQRIIDSVSFLNTAFEGGRIHMLLGLEALIISLEKGGIRTVSMCGFSLPTGLNGKVIEGISRYLHELPHQPVPSRVLADIRVLARVPPPPLPVILVAIAIFTMVFGFFNHADPAALAIIGIAAAFAGLMRIVMARHHDSPFFAILIATLAGALTSAALSQVIPTKTPLVAVIIPCVFLIPGFQLINGGWEILRSHLHIGIPRVMIFLSVITIIGFGLLAVLLVYNPGTDGPGIFLPEGWNLFMKVALGGIAAASLSLIMNVSRTAMAISVLCGTAGRFVDTVIMDGMGHPALAVFCGTLVISVLALILCSKNPGVPVAVPIVSASAQFLPGYYSIICIQGLARIINAGPAVPFEIVGPTVAYGLMTLFISMAIVLGTLLPLFGARRHSGWY